MQAIRILIVTDDEGGFMRSNSDAHKFHLGEFVKVLTDTAWQGFTIQIVKAHRRSSTGPDGADLHDFRFTADSLRGFDMVFFFSIHHFGEEDVGLRVGPPAAQFTTDAQRREEAAAVAAFMEAGGGFFATGDHADIGGAVNMHIPRIRSMRRWVAAGTPNPRGLPLAPSASDADRHDTLRAGGDSGAAGGATYPYQFNDQSDNVPQPIRVRRYPIAGGRIARTTLPHPLLCSPLGVIDVLPDHMHEGWCEAPADLSLPEDLPGRAGKPEYPPGPDGRPLAPEVIAEATIEPHATLNQEFGGFVSPPTSRTTPFGVIAAYDGHRAGVGRAVVGSTWHHFVNINVIGTSRSFAGSNANKTKGFYTGPGDTPVPAYQKIMWFYRNLVYWLIPTHRRRTALFNVAQTVWLHPRWEELKGKFTPFWTELPPSLKHVVDLGQLAEDYFASTRGRCLAYELVIELLYPVWRFDPLIRDRWLPHLDPWALSSHKVQRKAADEAVAALLPDTRVLLHLALGCAVGGVLDTGARQADEEGRLFEHAARAASGVFARTLPELAAALGRAQRETRLLGRLLQETSKAATDALGTQRQ